MKIRLFAIISILALSFLLSACTGGAAANSWPGLTIDSSGEIAYVADTKYVYAVNTSNGMEKWRFTSEAEKGTFYAPPAETNDGQLIVGGYNKVLYAINKDTGQQNWAFYEAQHNYVAKPLVTDDFIYAPCSDNNLYALTLDGTLKWTFETEYPQWGTPVADGDVIYLSSMDHSVYALNAQSGELIWKTEDLKGAIEGSPVISENGVIYIGTLGSSIVALSSEDGSVLWQTPTTGWVFGSPVIYKDSIIFGDLAGTYGVWLAARHLSTF